MNTRLLLTWCLLICIPLGVRAQTGNEVLVTVIIPPPYSPYLQDYLQYENKMVIQLQNLSTQTLSAKLVGSIEGDNGIALRTNTDYLPTSPVTLLPGALVRIPASSRSRGFIDPDNLDFIGPENLKTQILKDGILPEGLYTVCVRAVDYQTNVPLSEEEPLGCALLPISYPTPPQLMSPECEGVSDQMMPFFQWTLPGGNTGNSALAYDLFIVEWLRGTNPQDLMQLAVDYNAGNAIVKRDLNTPSYQYQPFDIRLMRGKTYLWAVRVKDRLMQITFENYGLSEICSFTLEQLTEEDDDGITYQRPNPFDNIQIVQNRTLIEGKLNYRFPGSTPNIVNFINQNLNPGTGNIDYILADESPFEIGILGQSVMALEPKNYIDAFPVPIPGSDPLQDMTVKLLESWVIMDCDVTYFPDEDSNVPIRTVHKDFFILPDDVKTRGVTDGGNSQYTYIDGITNLGDGINPLSLGSDCLGCFSYSRVLAVGRTDANGKFSIGFTQSTPGLHFINYPGSASVTLHCERGEVEVEVHEWVHPLDMHANPSDVLNDLPASVSNPYESVSNPAGIQENFWGDPHIGDLAQGNTTFRSGNINTAEGQEGYGQIQITGGKLLKVLRLEVASPYYYSPDLIFWTKPGDTLKLPDQVSYVKSFDLEMVLEGGRWQNQIDYQDIPEGEPVAHTDVLFSRKKQGLPMEIPMEEGQGLRDYAGEPSGGPMYDLEENQMHTNPGLVNTQPNFDGDYDSVSIEQTGVNGSILLTKLVTAHPYYIQANPPLDDGVHYQMPITMEQYEVFDPAYCKMNVETNLNSFSQHKAVFIRDTFVAYPLAPRIFGRVVTETDVNKETMEGVRVTLKRLVNNVFQVYETQFTDNYGRFLFDNLPVDDVSENDYSWRVEFREPGYADFNTGTVNLLPGAQWDLKDVSMIPLGSLVGYVRDEKGKLIRALVRLADGPHVQTDVVAEPYSSTEFCGIVNQIGDGIDEATRLNNLLLNQEHTYTNANQSAKFILPAQSGQNRRLVVIPLPEQYFQDTCYMDVEEVPYGQTQFLGNITVKEKLHRIIFTVKGPTGNPVNARVMVDEYVRQTTPNGWAAFRFASPEINYRVRIDPELPTLVPVDTIMRIPISKEYLAHTFKLKEGRSLKIKVIVDQSDYVQQSANPLPVNGAVVQTFLSSSPTGNNYIQCITDQNGECKLEGVPTAQSTVEVTAMKEDPEHLYIGKTVSVSTSRPLNPPFEIALKRLSNISVPDVWGFPTAITGMEIQTVAGGLKDTLLQGFITGLPENNQFKSKEEEVRIPYPKVKFKYAGRRTSDGHRILEPVASSLTLNQPAEDIMLFDKFDVTLKPKRNPNIPPSQNLRLHKIDQQHGNIIGTVETELSSFNFSYSFDGKFFLGDSPTDYNIEVFKSGMPNMQVQTQSIGQVVMAGAEPEPGPNDFYLMDMDGLNRPRSHAYTVFQFPATSDSSRSFVSSEAFYIHTILHTNIQHVHPSDLELNIGKIKVSLDEIEDAASNSNKLDFKMGSLWRYYSTVPFRYDPDLGGVTVTHGFIQTGQIDVPVTNPIIKPTDLIMNDIGNIGSLTLAGIKPLTLNEGVNVVLSKGEHEDIGWMLTVQKVGPDNRVIPDAIVSQITNLPPLQNGDTVYIGTILLHSEDPEMDLTLSGDVRPYNIADMEVHSITTGPGYFRLEGNAELGRHDVRVPHLSSSRMHITYTGSPNNITGKITSNYHGTVETAGKVEFEFDQSTSTTARQYYKDKHFVSVGTITVYEDVPGGGERHFALKGILEVKYNSVKLYVIDESLNIPNIIYTHKDQPIHFDTDPEKMMMVRSGLQETNENEWGFLNFDANLRGFNGVDSLQPPMTYIVSGDVNATGANLKVDNIEIGSGVDLGFGSINFTYDFAEQSLFGDMYFEAPPPGIMMGPVTVSSILAQILVEPQGFLFASVLEGQIAGAFDATLGLLLGSHSSIPGVMINAVMADSRYEDPPETIADGSLNGFFIAGQVLLADVEMPEVNIAEVLKIKGSAVAGFDARLYMDFDAGGFAFGMEALGYADISGQLSVILVPCDLCLSAELEIGITATLEQQGDDWEVAGTGCGSVNIIISVCPGVEFPPIGGKVDVVFSNVNTDVNAAWGESCSGGNADDGMVCDQ